MSSGIVVRKAPLESIFWFAHRKKAKIAALPDQSKLKPGLSVNPYLIYVEGFSIVAMNNGASDAIIDAQYSPTTTIVRARKLRRLTTDPEVKREFVLNLDGMILKDDGVDVSADKEYLGIDKSGELVKSECHPDRIFSAFRLG
ncbi:MAG: hypothetical protein AB7G06_07495 [Bdellovibrionales bacterium]